MRVEILGVDVYSWCAALRFPLLPQLRLLCQLDNAVDVTVLPPYVPSAEERANPKLFAANVRALYGKTLQLPLVNQSQHEFRCARTCTQGLLICTSLQRALSEAGVRVSMDGRRVLAPPGVLDATGRYADLTAPRTKAA